MLKPNNEICLKSEYQLKQETISRKKKLETDQEFFNFYASVS